MTGLLLDPITLTTVFLKCHSTSLFWLLTKRIILDRILFQKNIFSQFGFYSSWYVLFIANLLLSANGLSFTMNVFEPWLCYVLCPISTQE